MNKNKRNVLFLVSNIIHFTFPSIGHRSNSRLFYMALSVTSTLPQSIHLSFFSIFQRRIISSITRTSPEECLSESTTVGTRPGRVTANFESSIASLARFLKGSDSIPGISKITRHIFATILSKRNGMMGQIQCGFNLTLPRLTLTLVGFEKALLSFELGIRRTTTVSPRKVNIVFSRIA